MTPESDSSGFVIASAAPGFTTTHWSVVLAAGEDDSASSREALEKLCQSYWRPIYAYVRRRGHPPPEAEDLTQAFFAHFLERKLQTVADRQRGRFRTFVLHACEYFLAKQWRDANRLKRGGGQTILSLDVDAAEDSYQNLPADTLTPERLFERQWALALLDLTRERLREEWTAAGKETLFATLQVFLTGEQQPYAPTALALGLSEGAVRTAVHRLRQRYGEILRAEVAQTLSRPDDLEDELRHLLVVL
jgi:RNA polymerase sigma-70 factor (ECF subfamily)